MNLKIKVLQDYRKLKKNEVIEFNSNLTFVVGHNGSGKSTLLNLIRSHWAGHYQGRERNPDEYIEITGLENFDVKFDYNTETDSYKGQSFADMDYLLSNNGLGIQVMRASSGEAQNATIASVFKKIADAKDKKVLIILDEPEKGLDIKFQLDLLNFLNLTSMFRNFMYIVATHSVVLLQNTNGMVYDMDTKSYTKSKAYIKEKLSYKPPTF
jgi:predicted ATPase